MSSKQYSWLRDLGIHPLLSPSVPYKVADPTTAVTSVAVAARSSAATALDDLHTLKLSCSCMAWAPRRASVAALGFSSNLQLSDTRHHQTRGTVNTCPRGYKLVLHAAQTQVGAGRNAPIDHAPKAAAGQSVQNG